MFPFLLVSIGIIYFIYCNEKKDRWLHLSTFLLVLLIYIIMSGNYNNADYDSYKLSYYTSNAPSIFQFTGQWAYYLLIRFCRTLRLSYEGYRHVLIGLGCIFLIFAINSIQKKSFSILLLYMIYTMIIDTTQLKNFMAMAAITLSLTYLTLEETVTIRRKIVSLLLIVLGAGFHVAALIYLPIIILYDPKAKKGVKVVSVIPVVLFAVVFSNRQMSGLLSRNILSIMDSTLASRASSFLLSRVNNGYIVYFFATFSSLIIVRNMSNCIINSSEYSLIHVNFARLSNVCAMFSLVFLPFYFLRQDFSRFLRNLFIVYHILFSLYSMPNRLKSNGTRKVLYINKRKILIQIAYICLVFYMFYWDIFGYKETVLIPFFQYNIWR